MVEILRFILFTLLLTAGILLEITAVLGVNRFRYSLNRLHSASVGDTLALMCIIAACVVKTGASLLSIKFILVLIFMMLTGPMSGHLISMLVVRTDRGLEKEVKPWRR